MYELSVQVVEIIGDLSLNNGKWSFKSDKADKVSQKETHWRS